LYFPGYEISILKRLSMQVQIPVLSVASLSRECEKRENKRPVLVTFGNPATSNPTPTP
jgi:hypothetical protein